MHDSEVANQNHPTNREETTSTSVLPIKDKQLLSLLQTNASKVVDANSEPLIVYHGSSSNNITEFGRNGSTRESSGLKEFGHFFSTNRDIAERYADIPKRKKLLD